MKQSFLKSFFSNKQNILITLVSILMILGINASNGFSDLTFIVKFGINAFLILIPVVNFLKELSDWTKNN